MFLRTLLVSIFMCIALTIVGCGSQSEDTRQSKEVAIDLQPSKEPTKRPSVTPQPTYTALPTYTPLATHTPLPTYTPLATSTASPSPTSVDNVVVSYQATIRPTVENALSISEEADLSTANVEYMKDVVDRYLGLPDVLNDFLDFFESIDVVDAETSINIQAEKQKAFDYFDTFQEIAVPREMNSHHTAVLSAVESCRTPITDFIDFIDAGGGEYTITLENCVNNAVTITDSAELFMKRCETAGGCTRQTASGQTESVMAEQPTAISATNIPPTSPPPTQPPPTAVPPTQPPSNEEIGIVTKITDGDTIHVAINGQDFPVRLIGINTPEYNELCGNEATQALANLISGAQVRLVKDVSNTDRYDRLLRYVYAGDLFVNAEMVRQGYAEAIRYPPDTAQAGYLESMAASAPVPSCQQLAAPDPTEQPPAADQPPPAVAAIGNLIIAYVDKKAEFVDIQNNGGAAIDLGGWTLVSEKGAQACGLGGQIPAGAVLRIWAMAEDAGQGGFNCNFGSNIWNNSEHDPAVLYDPSGNEVARR